jgi:hypothetical protein
METYVPMLIGWAIVLGIATAVVYVRSRRPDGSRGPQRFLVTVLPLTPQHLIGFAVAIPIALAVLLLFDALTAGAYLTDQRVVAVAVLLQLIAVAVAGFIVGRRLHEQDRR